MPEAFPLDWPVHYPRTRRFKRRNSKFAKRGFGQIRDELLDELRRLGARRVTVSSDIPLRLDGLPYATTREPDDCGAAVYFTWMGEPYVIACDTYLRVWENVRAVSKTIEAMRAIERHGASQLLERAVSGFAALPPGGDNEHAAEAWWDVLGCSVGLDANELGKVLANPESPMRAPLLEVAKTMYRAKVKDAHPDRGGSDAALKRLNLAMEQARRHLERKTA